MKYWFPLISLALAAIPGCSSSNGPDSPRASSDDEPVKASAKVPDEAENEATFLEPVLESVGAYEPWGRVDQPLRWAPELCSMPPPGIGRFSASREEETHGRKLYYLFAKEREAYLQGGSTAEQIGQVVVKEAWKPVEVPGTKSPYERDPKTGRPYAQKDGRFFSPGELAGLFIMLRLPPDTPGTDEGWVYATVAPDRKTVTDLGRIDSCMRCHVREGKGRLFGLPMDPD